MTKHWAGAADDRDSFGWLVGRWLCAFCDAFNSELIVDEQRNQYFSESAF